MNEEFLYDHIRYSACCDMLGWQKLSAILDAMQTTADRHNETLKCSRAELSTRGLTWVLFKTMVQVDRYPRNKDKLESELTLKNTLCALSLDTMIFGVMKVQVLVGVDRFWCFMGKENRKAVIAEKKRIQI